MKNSAILDMVVRQYGWDHRDVQVEFLSHSSEGYEFRVEHEHPYEAVEPVKLIITVKVEFK